MKVKRIFGVLLLTAVVATGCESTAKPTSQQREQRVTEEYQKKLAQAVPYPLDQMNDSLERRQLRERLLRFNKPSKIAYIYLLSNVGTVVAFYTVKGKVSSVNSMLTVTQQVNECGAWSDRSCVAITDAAGDDGSYGTNGTGVFFFTTEGTYVEWAGNYMLADSPLKLTSAPLITYDPSSKPTSVGDPNFGK